MPKSNTQEERQIMKLIEKLPFPTEEKAVWTERVRNGEMSHALADEMRAKINTIGEADDDGRGQAARTRYLTELTMLVKRWELTSQSHNFGRK